VCGGGAYCKSADEDEEGGRGGVVFGEVEVSYCGWGGIFGSGVEFSTVAEHESLSVFVVIAGRGGGGRGCRDGGREGRKEGGREQ